jgi:CO/xanthine dehydrogenase Mo-binding subunit
MNQVGGTATTQRGVNQFGLPAISSSSSVDAEVDGGHNLFNGANPIGGGMASSQISGDTTLFGDPLTTSSVASHSGVDKGPSLFGGVGPVVGSVPLPESIQACRRLQCHLLTRARRRSIR